MKKIITTVLILCCTMQLHLASAQQAELEQLALNIQKLAQFKQILADLKKSYTILYNGYTSIKDISEGNFDLHKKFLDGLLAINPTLKNYQRVKDIISYEAQLLSEYKSAYKRFKNSNRFTMQELDYLSSVYTNLTDQSIKNLDELTTILTASRLRMSDEERLSGIDHIYNDMREKLSFLRMFNRKTTAIEIRRTKELEDAKRLKQLYDQKN